MKTPQLCPWIAAAALAARVLAADPMPAADAAAAIRAHRTGTLEVTVVDAAGQPVPGAEVRVEQLRHEFLFGCNIFAFERFATPELNRIYQERFAALFNFATLPFYWATYEREAGHTDAERIERIARWCRGQGITPKGHPLVWNHPAGAPRWLPADPAEVQKLSAARVRDCVSRFRGLIEVFDVVNEAADPLRKDQGMDNPVTGLIRKIGVEDYVRTPFRIAREANPDATLLINDYRTGADYERVIGALRDDGRPLYQVIGIQSHMHGGVWPAARTRETCDRLARFGVPLHFTEVTIVSGPRDGDRWGETTPELEQAQARQAVDFYTLLFSHPAVEAITWWDFADAHAWQGAAAGFLRRDLTPKPVYGSLHDLIKGAWWTRAKEAVGAKGNVSFRAFFGRHRVGCTLPDGRRAEAEVDLKRRAGRAECRLQLPEAR